LTLFSIWLAAQPWRKYWKLVSHGIVLLIGYGLPLADWGSIIVNGKIPVWAAYLTISFALVWAALYFNKASQAKTLQGTVMREGMIKADALIKYKVWPESEDDNGK
jgi:hypothetical protein